MVQDLDDPRAQAQQLIADARRDFASDMDALLQELRVFVDSTATALGDVSREDALRDIRRFVLQKFDQRLSMKSSADPVLLRLVREAFDRFTDPHSLVDLQVWKREARLILRADSEA